MQQYARRVGLAPEVACAAGVDAPVGSVLTEYGCRTLLRATYVDQTSSFAFTVGIAVLASEESGSPPPVSWRWTTAWGCGRWRSPARRPSGSAPPSGSATPGSASARTSSSPPPAYTDGRTRESISPEEILHSELWPTAQAVAGRIARALGDEPSAVPQCTQGNVC